MTLGSVEDFRGTERFEIRGQLGAGGMGVVYRAFDHERGEEVALKTLLRIDAAALYRFKREFRSLADVVHPSLIALHELVCDRGQWFFTMELVDGTNFLSHVRNDETPVTGEEVITALCTAPGAEAGETSMDTVVELAPVWSVPRPSELSHAPALIRRPGDERPRGLSSPLHVGRLREAMTQLVEAVMALHDVGMIHRDIKPSNVLVTPDGRVVLLDFGLVTDLASTNSYESMDIPLAGTAAYMSPEQGSSVQLTPASDWYSVGVMLYQALAGRLPFIGGNIEVLMRKRRVMPPPARALAPRVPLDLNDLAMDLLAIRPGERPSGDEILRRLGSTAGGLRPSGQERVASASNWPKPIAPAELGAVAGRAFVGREPHFAKLTGALTVMRQGRPVTLFVEGKSGMGKSALVRAFLDALRNRDDTVVLEGRCYERESVPYKALDTLVDELTRYLRRLQRLEAQALLPDGVLALARVFPVLRRIEAVSARRADAYEIPDPAELRSRAFAALREILRRLARKKAVIIHIDDLQWGDVDSATVLGELLRPPDAPQLLFIAAFQSDIARQSAVLEILLGSPAAKEPETRHVVVGPLTPYGARDLALALLSRDDAVARAHAEVIAAESGGSPLFVHELVRWLQTTDASGGERDPSALGITLEHAIASRIGELPADAKKLLEVICVAGRPIDLATASRAAALGPEGHGAVALLRASHLVRTVPVAGEDRVASYHDRVGEVIVQQIAPEALRQRHLDIALALETARSPDSETVAFHYAAAGDRAKASEHAIEAARQAANALAFDRAANLYRLALEGVSDTGTERQLRVKLGEVLIAAGRSGDAARELFKAAHGLPPADAFELRRIGAEHLLRFGHYEEGIAAMSEVLRDVGIALPETPERALVSLLARRAILALRGTGFKERDPPNIAPEVLSRIDACWSGAIGLALVDAIRGAELQARHALLALGAGEPRRVARALAGEATYSATRGGRAIERTRELLERMTELARKINEPHAFGMAEGVTGLAFYLQGRFADSLAHSERAEKILRERCTGVAFDLGSAEIFSLGSLAYLGELRRLSERVPYLVKEAEERGDVYSATMLRTGARNLHWLVVGDPDEARRQVHEAKRQWTTPGFLLQHYFRLIARVQIDLYTGDWKAAHARVTREWRALERSQLLRVQFVRVEAWQTRARTALAAAARTGEPEPLLAEATKLANRIEREGMAYAEPLALILHAGVAARRGRAEEASDLLISAASGFDAVQMALHAAAARRRLGEILGGDEGRLRVEGADAWMRAQGVREPSRLAAVIAPFRG